MIFKRWKGEEGRVYWNNTSNDYFVIDTGGDTMASDMIYYIMLKMGDGIYKLPNWEEHPIYTSHEEAKAAAIEMGYMPDEIQILEWSVD